MLNNIRSRYVGSDVTSITHPNYCIFISFHQNSLFIILCSRARENIYHFPVLVMKENIRSIDYLYAAYILEGQFLLYFLQYRSIHYRSFCITLNIKSQRMLILPYTKGIKSIITTLFQKWTAFLRDRDLS